MPVLRHYFTVLLSRKQPPYNGTVWNGQSYRMRTAEKIIARGLIYPWSVGTVSVHTGSLLWWYDIASLQNSTKKRRKKRKMSLFIRAYMPPSK